MKRISIALLILCMALLATAFPARGEQDHLANWQTPTELKGFVSALSDNLTAEGIIQLAERQGKRLSLTMLDRQSYYETVMKQNAEFGKERPGLLSYDEYYVVCGALVENVVPQINWDGRDVYYLVDPYDYRIYRLAREGEGQFWQAYYDLRSFN